MGLWEIANPNQLSRGIMPLPGTPAYEALARNILNSNPVNDAQSAFKNTAQRAVSDIAAKTGVNYGMVAPRAGDVGDPSQNYAYGAQMDPRIAKSGQNVKWNGFAWERDDSGGTGGGGGGGTSSGSSSMSTGAGLMDEILGLIRGTGGKEMQKARARLTEDYGTAKDQKMNDLARRGLFRAGIGEEEMLREVDKPFARGAADLESALADSNVDTQLRKAGILGDIEAQARKAAAERSSQMWNQGAATGGGSQTINLSSGAGLGDGYKGDQGAGGIFGAQFVDARKRAASGAAGGGDVSGFMPNVPYLGGSTGAGQSASQSWQTLPANMGMQKIATPTGPGGQQIYGSGSSAYYRDASGARMGATPQALALQQQQGLQQNALSSMFSGGASMFGRR